MQDREADIKEECRNELQLRLDQQYEEFMEYNDRYVKDQISTQIYQ